MTQDRRTSISTSTSTSISEKSEKKCATTHTFLEANNKHVFNSISYFIAGRHYKPDRSIVKNALMMLAFAPPESFNNIPMDREQIKSVKLSANDLQKATIRIIVETTLPAKKISDMADGIQYLHHFTGMNTIDKEKKKKFLEEMNENLVAVYVDVQNRKEQSWYVAKTIMVNPNLSLENKSTADQKDKKSKRENDEEKPRRHWYSCCR